MVNVVSDEQNSEERPKSRIREKYENQQRLKKEAHDAAILKIHNEIVSKLGDKESSDWLRMPVYSGLSNPSSYLYIPRLAFLHWALKNVPAVKLGIIEDWVPVSKYDLKCKNDDRFHSDWVIGAGLDPATFYDKNNDINISAHKLAMEIVRDMTSFDLLVLSRSSRTKFEGEIAFLKPGQQLEKGQIGIISHAGVEFDAALRSAARHKTGLICLTGGPLAHVVTVGRELDVPIVMWDKANNLRIYQYLYVNTENGTVSIRC